MGITGNNIQNNGLAALTQRAGPQTTAAIRQASLKTGVDFAYMMEKAAAESSFDIDAKAKTSSAKGLYQFIESTWLQMVNRYGDKHGLGAYADQISNTGKVADPAARRDILALRNDPEVASLMAGEFAAENKRTLMASGIAESDIGPTELYLAHFLGAGAASEFIKGMQDNPLTPAADLFPRAAAANKNVFYKTNTQQAKSLGEIHALFERKFNASESGAQETVIAESVAAATRDEQRTAGIMRPTRTPNAGAARISPEMMAYLNGEKESYSTMQEQAINILSADTPADEPAPLRMRPTRVTTGFNAPLMRTAYND